MPVTPSRVPTRASDDAQGDQAHGRARERPPADLRRHLEAHLDLAGQHRLERPDLGVGRAQALDVRAQDRQRDRARGGSGPARPARRAGSTACPIALEPLARRVPVRDRAAPPGAPSPAWTGARSGAVSDSERRSRATESASRSRSRRARASSPRPEPDRRLGDGILGDLQRDRGSSRPRAWRPRERPLELPARPAGAAVGAADRCLEAVAERALVALRDRRARGGGPRRWTGRSPRWGSPDSVGQLLVGASRVRDDLAAHLEADLAARPAERLLEAALELGAILVVVGERHADDRCAPRRPRPRARGPRCRRRRW